MESLIDQRYRLDLIKYHLDGFEEKQGKSVFYCPLCQIFRHQGKYVQKKGGMFWCAQWNAWRFNCVKCLQQATTMYLYLMRVNPIMARQYQRERFHTGCTGKGTDCPNPANSVQRAEGSRPIQLIEQEELYQRPKTAGLKG
jgi:hypothetical protein